MPADPTAGEQAVARAIRDNLAGLQRLGEDLHQALADLVSACASSRPANALPPLIRAQTSSASLQASLDVLARFIAMSFQHSARSTGSEDILRMVGIQSPQPSDAPPMPPIPTPMDAAAPHFTEPEPPPAIADSFEDLAAESLVSESPAIEESLDPAFAIEAVEPEPANGSSAASVAASAAFDISALPINEQELHKRANRVAKVSMQDIKMLKPKDVIIGRENHDLCHRLRDDIERARKEYDRRFRVILEHPVDYFYHWMVEILADGDPGALGEYPYPSPVLRQ